MTISTLASAGLLAVLALTASAAAKPAPAALVAAEGGWINEAPPGSKVMGGFVTVINRRKHPITLQRAESPLFTAVQMHSVRKAEGRETMEPMRTATIAAGGRLRFVPGGNHLMLMNPKRRLKAGDVVMLTLDFGKDGRQDITLPVKGRGAEPGHGEHAGDEHGAHDGHSDH